MTTEPTPVPVDDISTQEKALLAKLQEKGGHAGNVTLQRELGISPEIYWSVRDRLVDSGKLELGRGKGGSVSLVAQLVPRVGENIADSEKSTNGDASELALYTPVATVLKNEWAKDMRFRSHVVEVTALQGRRKTGGTWTRPDIVVAALRVFPHVPGKFFDLVTFELKTFDAIDVTAVFEALAHRRSATQSYVWAHVPTGKELHDELAERITEEARRHGVGLIVGSDPADYSSWEIHLQAVRADPDPESLNEFIAQQLPALARDELAQWFR